MSFNLKDSEIKELLMVYHTTPRLSSPEFEAADRELDALIREKHPSSRGETAQTFPKSKERRLFFLAMKINQFDAWKRAQTQTEKRSFETPSFKPRQLQLL